MTSLRTASHQSTKFSISQTKFCQTNLLYTLSIENKITNVQTIFSPYHKQWNMSMFCRKLAYSVATVIISYCYLQQIIETAKSIEEGLQIIASEVEEFLHKVRTWYTTLKFAYYKHLQICCLFLSYTRRDLLQHSLIRYHKVIYCISQNF